MSFTGAVRRSRFLPQKLDGKKTDPPDGRNSLFAESGTPPLLNASAPPFLTCISQIGCIGIDYFLSRVETEKKVAKKPKTVNNVLGYKHKDIANFRGGIAHGTS